MSWVGEVVIFNGVQKVRKGQKGCLLYCGANKHEQRLHIVQLLRGQCKNLVKMKQNGVEKEETKKTASSADSRRYCRQR